MIVLRKSENRGHANHGWLDTYHTFSFNTYYDPAHVHFRDLRVINEDRVAPGRGFGTHPHENMEILTYVLEGALQHKDSMGTGSVIRPGDLQRMSAGTGVTHSEFNGSKSEPVHLLQIWIFPEAEGIEPGYEQKTFPASERSGQLKLVASRSGRDGSLTIHQNVDLYASILDSGQQAHHSLAPGRHAWLQVARGSVTLNGKELQAGDGAAVSQEPELDLQARDKSEILLFDLA
ncbi:MAG TPA: pirin family protein [Terriglobia bacterium]|nr:pirin family protein [Terriglobia bacterium]